VKAAATAAAALMVLVACDVRFPGALASPSPRAKAATTARTTPTPAGSPTATTATPVATPTSLGFSCRLPVAAGDPPADGNPTHGTRGAGGFVTFPAATFAADPMSMSTYDRAKSRWLPVPRAWVAPDGNHYTYPEYRTDPGPVTGIIHITDAGTLADRTVIVPTSSRPLSYEASGVWATGIIPNSGAPPAGLFVVEPLRQVIADRAWYALGGSFAYGSDPPYAPGMTSNSIIRIDLSSAAVGTYLASSPGKVVQVIGFDASNNPVLSIVQGTNATIRIGTTDVWSGAAAGSPTGPVVADSHGLWLSSGDGHVWFYTSGQPVLQVASIGSGSVAIAGGCA
jgi:hypothetical protein